MDVETNIIQNVKGDKNISIALVSTYVVLTIQYFLIIFFELSGTQAGNVLQSFSQIIVGVIFVHALPEVFKRNKVLLISIYLIFSFVFLFNYLFFISNRPYLQDLFFTLFFISIPSFVYTINIDDFNILKETMIKASNIVFICGLLIAIINLLNIRSIGVYSIALSYYMLLPLIISVDSLFDKLTIKNTIVASMSLLVILSIGSRGAVLCFGVFIILKILNMNWKLTYKSVISFTVLFFVTLISVIKINDIFYFLYNNLLNYGISSRSLSVFLRGEIYFSGREQIYRDVIDGIKNNPIFGLGLVGDRVILDGGYVHNFFIEIITHFGIILGVVLLLFFAFFLIKSIFKKNDRYYDILLIWICLGFIHLMVSNSYIEDFRFWIFLGLLLKTAKL